MNPLRLLVLSFLSLLILSAAGSALYLHAKGDRLLSVQTNSMAPAFRPGDALLTKKVAVNELKVGDIISYRRPDTNVIVSHRLIEINYQTGRLVTEGDNNQSPDVPIPAALLVGKVYRIVPGLGGRLDWVHKPVGLALVIYLPAALVLIFESRSLAIKLKRKKYQTIAV